MVAFFEIAVGAVSESRQHRVRQTRVDHVVNDEAAREAKRVRNFVQMWNDGTCVTGRETHRRQAGDAVAHRTGV